MGCFSQSVLEQFLPREHGPVILAEDLQRCKGKGDLTDCNVNQIYILMPVMGCIELGGYYVDISLFSMKKKKERFL